MYDSSEHQFHKSIIAITSIIIAIILIIITISVLVINFSNRQEANIVNSPINSTVDSNSNSANNNTTDQQISEADLTRFKKELYNLLNKTQSANHDFDASVRWDTIQVQYGSFPNTSFLVDVDEYEQTYRVIIDDTNVRITCPKLGESKYPHSFCIGNGPEDDDSISVVFGSNLPYSGETNQGEYFSISRNDASTRQNIGDRYLEVLFYACPFDDTAITKANQAVDDVLTSLGAPTDLFRREILSGGGCHEN